MIIKAEEIATYLEEGNKPDAKDPLVIIPHCKLEEMVKSGSSSIDLRLGTWFVTLRQARMSMIQVGDSELQSQLIKTHYVPFGEEYILHPRAFVLGITLEWISLPQNFAAYVIGKSSWGRRGLIIATATGVHPGFKGCITLEMTNVGEIPIQIKPGMKICQIFIHEVHKTASNNVDHSQFLGSRKPRFGKIKPDKVATKLGEALKNL